MHAPETARIRKAASKKQFVKIEMYAGERSRTVMGLLPLDFESSAYTNFATPARC